MAQIKEAETQIAQLKTAELQIENFKNEDLKQKDIIKAMKEKINELNQQKIKDDGSKNNRIKNLSIKVNYN